MLAYYGLAALIWSGKKILRNSLIFGGAIGLVGTGVLIGKRQAKPPEPTEWKTFVWASDATVSEESSRAKTSVDVLPDESDVEDDSAIVTTTVVMIEDELGDV